VPARPADAYVTRTLDLCRAVERLTGLHVVWKNATGGNPGGAGRPVSVHCNPFCEAVKSSRARTARCRLEDNVRAVARAVGLRTCFTRTCHAGATELLVPVFDGDRYDGMLFVGPVRRARARCRYRDARRAHACLAVFDKGLLDAAAVVLSRLAASMAAEREAVRLREHAARALDARIAAALRHVDAHLGGPLRAGDLARRCHLSTSRFIHLFKEQTGAPFSDYVSRARVEHAKKLLRHTALRIADVAAEAGFANQNYFATVFRKLAGASPREFRRRHASVRGA
jgi:AraC-like DNA-binding protein